MTISELIAAHLAYTILCVGARVARTERGVTEWIGMIRSIARLVREDHNAMRAGER